MAARRAPSAPTRSLSISRRSHAAGSPSTAPDRESGRLHREHATKADVRIIDLVDIGHPALPRMWEKRQRGYRAMGYRIAADLDRGEASARLV